MGKRGNEPAESDDSTILALVRPLRALVEEEREDGPLEQSLAVRFFNERLLPFRRDGESKAEDSPFDLEEQIGCSEHRRPLQTKRVGRAGIAELQSSFLFF